MASTDAMQFPVKGEAYRHYFSIRKNDGTLITSWAGADSELSGDGASFGDATNEATEIDTSGFGYIDLTSDEMDYDAVILKVTVTNTDAITYEAILYTDAVSDIAFAVWEELLIGSTHNVPTSAGRRVREIASSIIITGTSPGGNTSNTIVLNGDASTTDGAYDPAFIYIVYGTGAGQTRLILEYTGSTKTAIVDRDWKVTPDDTSEYVIAASAGRETVNEGLAQAGTSTTLTLNALASSDDNAYVGQLIFIRSGTGADQVGLVSAYDGTTKIATIQDGWDTTPDGTSAYAMLPTDIPLATELSALVNAQVLDVMAVDTYAEPGQGTPAATTTLAAKINYLFKWMRNKKTQTATETSYYNDAGDIVDQKQNVSDDGTTATKGEMITGA